MEIILFQPQIPPNTGNIVRLCKATGDSLRLVKPLGFSISDKALKRAGLDYWDGVAVSTLDNLEEYLLITNRPFYFFSSKVKTPYTEAKYEHDSILIFGSETMGLPNSYFEKWKNNFYTIPMRKEARCLNLSNSVAIVTYEAHRQLGTIVV